MSLNSFPPRWTILASLLLLVLLAPAVPLSSQEPAAVARRIADIASVAVDEYAEGVREGRIVRREEFDEARAFMSEARSAAAAFDPATRAEVAPPLERLERGIVALAPEAELRAILAELRERLERTVGVSLDPMPPAAPSLARGAAIYRGQCAQCHGWRGAGDGPLAEGMRPPPADLTDAALRAAAPVEFFRKINVGVAGTAMPGFAERLDLGERWSVALYASLLRRGAEDLGRWGRVLAERCADCVLLVSDFATTAGLSDDSLAAVLAAMMAPADSVLPAALVGYARAAGAVEHLGADGGLAGARAVARARRMVAEAERFAAAGDAAAAARRALDAYVAFEEIETAVRARSPRAAGRVERAFTDYRRVLAGARAPAVRGAARAEVEQALDRALVVIGAESSMPALFAQSLVILLREGLEAILIIGALTAVLTKAGAAERRREIGWGALAAVGCSLLTAVAFDTFLRVSARQRELIEGVTMLVAAAVLFWVSYWLVSKIELRKWLAFVRGQVGAALASGRGWALAAVAFLAVYREGFETVLFYAALFASAGGAPGVVGAVAAGMAAGGVMLAAVYLLMQRYGVQLPLKPFFAVTSGLLYLMAFSFAGQGVAELQEAGVVSATPLDWLPAVPFLGIFPTIQTAFSQLLLAAALLGALLWVFWLEPRGLGARAA